MVCLFSRLSGHDIELSLLIGKGKGRIDVSSDADDQHEDVGKRKWDLQDDQGNEGPDFSHIRSKQVYDGLLEVIEDLSAFLDTVNDG